MLPKLKIKKILAILIFSFLLHNISSANSNKNYDGSSYPFDTALECLSIPLGLTEDFQIYDSLEEIKLSAGYVSPIVKIEIKIDQKGEILSSKFLDYELTNKSGRNILASEKDKIINQTRIWTEALMRALKKCSPYNLSNTEDEFRNKFVLKYDLQQLICGIDESCDQYKEIKKFDYFESPDEYLIYLTEDLFDQDFFYHARLGYRNFILLFPNHEMIDYADKRYADTFYYMGQKKEAAWLYSLFISTYPESYLLPNSYVALAYSYLETNQKNKGCRIINENLIPISEELEQDESFSHWIQNMQIENMCSSSGSYYYNNGDIYEGEFQNGKPHGQGIYKEKNYEYAGEFKDGLFHGKGEINYFDGDKYLGDFVYGLRDGKGILTYSDGRIYDGEFLSDNFHNYGTLIDSNGNKKVMVYNGGEFLYSFNNNDKQIKKSTDLICSSMFTNRFYVYLDNKRNQINVKFNSEESLHTDYSFKEIINKKDFIIALLKDERDEKYIHLYLSNLGKFRMYIDDRPFSHKYYLEQVGEKKILGSCIKESEKLF